MRKISQTGVDVEQSASGAVHASNLERRQPGLVTGVGIELMDIREHARLWNADPERAFRWFTDTEIAYCSSKCYPARHFAARFAAKRALLKAIRQTDTDDAPWLDIETVNDDFGYPRIYLLRKMRAIADQLGIKSIDLSLTHTNDDALAVVGINLTATLASKDSRL